MFTVDKSEPRGRGRDRITGVNDASPDTQKSSVIDLISQICVLSVPKRLGDVRSAEGRQITATASVRAP